MLYANTINPSTLELLNEIMSIPKLNAFNLAGGTALALQIGHRRSLTYFDDAEMDDDLKLILPCDWENVKETIRQEISKSYQ